MPSEHKLVPYESIPETQPVAPGLGACGCPAAACLTGGGQRGACNAVLAQLLLVSPSPLEQLLLAAGPTWSLLVLVVQGSVQSQAQIM